MNDTTTPLNLVEQLRLVAEMDLAGSFAKDVCAEAADEIVRLRNIVTAPLSPAELRLIDKNCGWVAFKHAWNAVMKRRQEAIALTSAQADGAA